MSTFWLISHPWNHICCAPKSENVKIVQLVDGYSLGAEGRLITLYSASSLHKSFNNQAAVAKVVMSSIILKVNEFLFLID